MKSCIQSLLLLAFASESFSFVARPASSMTTIISSNNGILFSSSADVEEALLSVTLEKPLGMILEEVEEGQAKGVFVLELADEGSASASEFKDQLVGLKVSTVMGVDVTSMVFDDVMEKLIEAPSPVSIEFLTEATGDATVEFEVGTPVTIAVLEDGKETLIDAKVGDNLRKTLLENNIEVYKGLKKKLGKCSIGSKSSVACQ